MLGFSAGAELAMAAAIAYDDFDRKNAGDKLSSVSSRPDFVGSIYPGLICQVFLGNAPVMADAAQVGRESVAEVHARQQICMWSIDPRL